jgi:hypothetical protein
MIEFLSRLQIWIGRSDSYIVHPAWRDQVVGTEILPPIVRKCHVAIESAEVLPGNSLMGPSWNSLFISVDAGPEWTLGSLRLTFHRSGH